MLEHGGRLRAAAQRHGIPLEHWLDLSTGINPCGYTPPPIPAEVWQRLPEEDDGLEDAAAAYYGTRELLPVAGSQAAIQALPLLRTPCRVAVLDPLYAEHAHAWRRHAPTAWPAEQFDEAARHSDVLVLANPANPSGVRFTRERLLGWHAELSGRGGWLVVDEAFIDAEPGESLAGEAGRPGLVVLRSLGKFFGLAGARVGFVLAEAELRKQLAEHLGPWTLSGPARHAARAALADTNWQQATRRQLAEQGERLATLLRRHLPGEPAGPALFQWLPHPRAAALHDALARHGILVRLFASPAAVRFGLPADEAAWHRLDNALENVTRELRI
ncbi:threonine-phosphate decarboxylase [Pseudothauera nasutitermitis]|uniref:threonine-phosphate decarboxylase n=1 Tax=Pseudothauera nasutitermitis TaxID=2565930 RepID=A0A4V3WBP0_9RHOO|nr:threonine-phosphate decarboxylase CobD [Pseudothauera nasutitermitis]THF63993.1 threonine-phosphate decarboxylase [Pseudothauera nasutitermitis]